MRKVDKKREAEMDIINQTRDRNLMPRPVVFRDKKKYNRNVAKDEIRKNKELDE